MNATILPLLLGGALLCAGVARAADAASPEAPTIGQAKPEDAYIVTLQAIGGFAPSFPGSRELSAYPFPGISVRKIDEPEKFTAPDDSFSLALLDVSGFRTGPVGNFVFYREPTPGVHHVALTHEVGGFVEYGGVDHFRVRSELRQGVDGHKGFVAALGADVYGGAQAVTLSFGPRVSFGDNRYANAYYSVSPLESLASGGKLEPYLATGGFTAAGGMATVRYDFAPNLSATAYGGLQRLTGSVGSSPIPNVIGSRDQFSAGVSISRSFEVQKFW